MHRSIVPLLAGGLAVATAAAAWAGTTERISISSTGEQADGDSTAPTISADGRFVAFISEAKNLVPSDTNNTNDIFVRDRQVGTTERVSIATNGTQANGSSGNSINGLEMSATGRYVAFSSGATNLVPGGTNGKVQIFVRDRQAGTTSLVSMSSSGIQGNEDSSHPAISADGRYVAFSSFATNLAPGGIIGTQAVFVRDLQAKTTKRVSASSSGAQGKGASDESWISGDGRYVVFYSGASNLVSGDTNGTSDVFVRDRQAKTTKRVSVSSSGAQGNEGSYPGLVGRAITQDGRYVVFWSFASNLVSGDTNGAPDVFVRDRQAKTTKRVSVSSSCAQGNDDSVGLAISGTDGRFVAFGSHATNLVPGDTNDAVDIFVNTR
jgi:Tol biopolymer transport system component